MQCHKAFVSWMHYAYSSFKSFVLVHWVHSNFEWCFELITLIFQIDQLDFSHAGKMWVSTVFCRRKCFLISYRLCTFRMRMMRSKKAFFQVTHIERVWMLATSFIHSHASTWNFPRKIVYSQAFYSNLVIVLPECYSHRKTGKHLISVSFLFQHTSNSSYNWLFHW